MMKKTNLNDLQIQQAYLHSPEANFATSQKNNSVIVDEKTYIETHFKDLDKVLIQKINEADAVVGCVAWITHEGIINALAKRRNGVSIIIQKEDFLRPDINTNGFNYSLKMRELYMQLKPISVFGESSFRKKTEFNWYDPNKGSDWYEEAQRWIDVSIRCVGFRKQTNEFTLPRMHHKFLVFCNYKSMCAERPENYCYSPYAVWTGSFNMTRNGTMSLENGVFIKNSKVAGSYYGEWKNMLLLSEDLDWESDWAEPDVHRLDECSVIS